MRVSDSDEAAEFEGGRAAAERFLQVHSGRCYVYVLCRPEGRPFYVGKVSIAGSLSTKRRPSETIQSGKATPSSAM